MTEQGGGAASPLHIGGRRWGSGVTKQGGGAATPFPQRSACMAPCWACVMAPRIGFAVSEHALLRQAYRLVVRILTMSK